MGKAKDRLLNYLSESACMAVLCLLFVSPWLMLMWLFKTKAGATGPSEDVRRLKLGFINMQMSPLVQSRASVTC